MCDRGEHSIKEEQRLGMIFWFHSLFEFEFLTYFYIKRDLITVGFLIGRLCRGNVVKFTYDKHKLLNLHLIDLGFRKQER